MIAAGEWRAERPFNGHAGFHIWTAYSLFPNATWADIVREFLVAHKDPILLRTFTNTTRGEPWEESGTGRPWEELAARARQSTYKRGTVPQGACLLFLGIDCQIDRVEWQLVGRGPEHRKYVIDYGMIGRPIGEADCQRALGELLQSSGKITAAGPMSLAPCRDRCRLRDRHVLEFCRRYGPTGSLPCAASPATSRQGWRKWHVSGTSKRGTLAQVSEQLLQRRRQYAEDRAVSGPREGRSGTRRATSRSRAIVRTDIFRNSFRNSRRGEENGTDNVALGEARSASQRNVGYAIFMRWRRR